MAKIKRVLVTGGSGYIGSLVVRRLLEKGYEVSVFDNLERGHFCSVPSCAHFVKGDLKCYAEIAGVFSHFRPDAVIHFAAYALVGESMADPLMYFDNNVLGGINLLKAMMQIGCLRIIFSSSCATYGVPDSLPIEEDARQCPTNPYGQSKLMFEQIAGWVAQLKGLRPTFLRYFNAAGAVGDLGEDHTPETHVIPNVLKVAQGEQEYFRVYGTDYPTPDGTCVRDYVHIEDLAQAHLIALEHDCEGAFNLATGKGVSVMEVVEACRRVTGHPIPVLKCPRRPGDPPVLYASGKKARAILGWTPVHSDIDQIVRDAWTYHEMYDGSRREKGI